MGINMAVAGIFDIIDDIRKVAPIIANINKLTLLPNKLKRTSRILLASGTFESAAESEKVAITKNSMGLAKTLNI
jgi:hypothetical protein